MCDPLPRNMPAELNTILANCLTRGRRQFVDLVEPNSGLGEAINYMLKRWGKFTLFLRQAGVPLDNNLCELSPEEGRPPPQEPHVLQGRKRGPHRRRLHEPDLGQTVTS